MEIEDINTQQKYATIRVKSETVGILRELQQCHGMDKITGSTSVL